VHRPGPGLRPRLRDRRAAAHPAASGAVAQRRLRRHEHRDPVGAAMITVAGVELSDAAGLEPVPGFIESTFNPLVYHAAAQCLRGREFDGSRLAVVVASLVGDSTTTGL